MKKTKDNFIQIIIGTIFLCGMMVISYGNNTTLVLLVFACLFALGIAIKRYRYIIINIFIFLLSFQLCIGKAAVTHIHGKHPGNSYFRPHITQYCNIKSCIHLLPL